MREAEEDYFKEEVTRMGTMKVNGAQSEAKPEDEEFVCAECVMMCHHPSSRQ